ncbi:CHAT domain-containing protein [Streptomyces rhizoryzae]|uniref:CHAT domain-containing protein n=1 Tax=Streptomyces rhizoryzae TaxID=2932493 RepID=UPI00249E8401|nr:CHAT domain-containing protein [Streptomyces rhizoryzae]
MREFSRDPARDPSRDGSRDRLLVAVRRAIATVRDTGDLAGLRALERQGAVTRLVISMDGARWPDLAALHAVGLARWAQYVFGPDGAHQAEWEASLQPLSCVYARERDAVPPEAAAVLEALRAGRRPVGPRVPREVRRWVLAGLRQREELSADFVAAARGLDPHGRRPQQDTAALHPFLDLTPRHHPERVRALRLLAVSLRTRYRETGDAAVLAEAVRFGRELLLLIPAAGARWADAVAHHARVLGDHYRHTGDRGDLDEAVECGREALRHTPQDSEWLADRLDAFSLHLARRYDLSGAPADLNAAVDACRGAVRAAPAGAPDAVAHRARLAGLLVKRHRVTGDGAALDEAVQLVRGEHQPLPAPGRDRVLLKHAEVLHAQYRRTGSAGVLHEAVELYRQAAGERRARRGHRTDLATALGHLGNALYDLAADFPQDGPGPRGSGPVPAEPAALREAVAVHREAVAVSAADDPRRPGHLDDLARALRERARATGRPDALDEAIALLREAIESAHAARLFRPAMLSHLCAALLERHRHTASEEPEPKLIREAYVVAEAAARHATGPPAELLRLHRALAELATATGRRPEAAAAYTRAVALLPQVVPHQLHGSAPEDRPDRPGRGLPADAAAAVLRAGGPDAPARALEVLEQGRGILLTRSLGLHGEEEALRAAAPQLAARLTALRTALTAAAATTAAGPGDAADRRHRLAGEWDAVVDEARRLPGLEGFLKPPRLAALRPAAAGGPVVTVNTSPLRCDALVLTSGGVAAVPLPGLRHADAEERATRFTEALRTAELPGTPLVDRLTAQAYLRDTLGWLWDTTAAPVLAHLDRTAAGRPGPADGPRPPRLWLSATGPLALLPLHAAGHHGEDGGACTLLDRAVPSYTPTVAALAAAVRTARPRPPAPLVVAIPRTPGFAPLDGALTEADAAAARYGPGTVVLTGADATRSRLLAALPAATHLHLACHAVADPAGPYGSHLILYDQPLTVAEISRFRLGHGEFCYLSACATARSGQLPDEAVPLGGAFHLAGYGQVVATLWPVEDATAAEAARLFHTSPHPAPAAALHDAVRRLRAAAPLLPSRWAGHVHIGP